MDKESILFIVLSNDWWWIMAIVPLYILSLLTRWKNWGHCTHLHTHCQLEAPLSYVGKISTQHLGWQLKQMVYFTWVLISTQLDVAHTPKFPWYYCHWSSHTFEQRLYDTDFTKKVSCTCRPSYSKKLSDTFCLPNWAMDGESSLFVPVSSIQCLCPCRYRTNWWEFRCNP